MKKFGFGCMRLPMINDEVDINQFKEMVDLFMKSGFTYFDTARPYLNGKSELAIREALVSRYPRESYVIADKLSGNCFNSEEDLMPFFNSQLEALGVNYIDYYLMHAQSENNYDKYQRCHAYEFAANLKEKGLIKHFGFSFHDTPEFLEKILSEHPEVEFVQLQFNYLDYYNPKVQAKACYDVCVKHNKKVLVMEPIKGGSLINIPSEAREVFDKLSNKSNASFALRFVASHEQVFMILSGMSRVSDMVDNLNTMSDLSPLSDKEFEAINKVRDIIVSKKLIGCTGCRYCVEGCPKHILIPDHFSNMNEFGQYRNWSCYDKFRSLNENGHSSPSECIKCGKCENICPQHLKIRDLLVEVNNKFSD